LAVRRNGGAPQNSRRTKIACRWAGARAGIRLRTCEDGLRRSRRASRRRFFRLPARARPCRAKSAVFYPNARSVLLRRTRGRARGQALARQSCVWALCAPAPMLECVNDERRGPKARRFSVVGLRSHRMHKRRGATGKITLEASLIRRRSLRCRAVPLLPALAHVGAHRLHFREMLLERVADQSLLLVVECVVDGEPRARRLLV